jgi:hypothetical protein
MIISIYPPDYKICSQDIAIAKKMMKKYNAILIRYTDNFDKKIITNWWYCIKDQSDYLASLNAKRRYEINKE